MTIPEFTSKHCRSFMVSDNDEFIQDDELFLFDLNQLINNEIEKRMPSDAELMNQLRFRRIFDDSHGLFFRYGFDWLKSKLLK